MKVYHTFGSVYDKNSRILILGSMPSVKSREFGFYYMHPRNRFWPIIESLLNEPIPISIEEKISFLKRRRIALWDVVSCCEIKGSADASIKNAEPNDLEKLLKETEIKQIFTNGKTADKLYKTLYPKDLLPQPICLPSTSPANAAYSLLKLIDEWKIILKYL